MNNERRNVSKSDTA